MSQNNKYLDARRKALEASWPNADEYTAHVYYTGFRAGSSFAKHNIMEWLQSEKALAYIRGGIKFGANCTEIARKLSEAILRRVST